MSDPLATTNPRRAWHDGRAAGRAEVAVVLLDLIAELRGQADIWQEGDINEDRWDYPAMMLRSHVARALNRLREVGDE